MELKIHNTATGKKEVFEPIDKNNIGMYLCGPTVYDHIHIGNARPMIIFDVLYRLLRQKYGADNITYVRNITDVDDKINARASDENISIKELTDKTIDYFHADLEKLECLPPTYEPRATDHIGGMIDIIKILIEKDHAYVAENHVLFAVSSMDSYGKFANISKEELLAGARVETAPYKRNSQDFILWKPSHAGEPSWDNPWNSGGRPGWHIECSAMSRAFLGDSFDLHMGGQDLIFPHHQNEIAQSCCAFPNESFARYWMHNGYVLSEGKKMSKSLGNFYTVNELLNDSYNYKGDTIRLLLLQTHYRKPLDFSKKRLDETKRILGKFYRIIDKVKSETAKEHTYEVKQFMPILEALHDDLNTPLALSHWYETMEAFASKGKKDDFMAMRMGAEILGITHKPVDMSKHAVLVEQEIAKRTIAKEAKDFATADEIRDNLKLQGIELEDHADGTTWKIKGH